MDGFWQDVRHALRMLRKHPGFTATAIVTLALGIGVNTAIFSVINSVLLNPLPFAEPERLVYLNTTNPNLGPGVWSISYLNLVDFRQQNQTLEQIAVWRAVTLNFTGQDHTERVEGARVSSNLPRVLGVHPILGRNFHDHEDQPGAAPVTLISHATWQHRFGGEQAILGRSIQLDGQSYEIIGVLPPGIRYPAENTSLWIPFLPTVAEAVRGTFFLRPIARLKSGISLEQANAELKTVAARLSQQYPETNSGNGMDVIPLVEVSVGSVRRGLWVLLGAVGCVLLIACANVASLLLARSTGRHAEFATRIALGATRARLVRQMLTESVLLSLLGGAFGLMIAVGGVSLLADSSSAILPRASEIRIDLRILFLTLGLAIATGIAFGLMPAARLSRGSVADRLKAGAGRSGTRSAGVHRVLDGLVVAEVAIGLVLLTGAGLLLRSLVSLQAVNPGFVAHGLITFEMGAARGRYPSAPEQAELYRKIVERTAAVPGVESAAAVQRLPMFGLASTAFFQIEGRPITPGGAGPSADYRIVTPDYFQVLKIPVREGRVLAEGDSADGPDVAVVSASLAQKFWPGASPLGRRIQVGAATNRWREIVGVVGDVKLRGLDREAGHAIYWPMAQNEFGTSLRTVHLVVRPQPGWDWPVAAIRAAAREVDSEEGLATARSMDEVISGSYAQRRLNAGLLVSFAAIAAALAAVGLYAVLSFSVAQRTREFGIRLAVGASGASVLRMVLRQGLTRVLFGIAMGLLGAAALTRVMEGLLFQVAERDGATFAAVAGLLFVVSLLACYFPARRATRVDPLVALRSE